MTSASPVDDSFAEPDVTAMTGTALDEFHPIYLALARTTPKRVGLAPSEVDTLDLSLVAQLLGASSDAFDAIASTEFADVRARIEAGEDVTWGDT